MTAKRTPNPLSLNAMRRVRKMRRDRGWTNDEFARRLAEQGVPITPDMLYSYDIERRKDLTVDVLFAFAEVLGTTAQALVGPATCDTCQGAPPPGFECRACGAISGDPGGTP